MYSMRMARMNIYLPDELAERVRAADINVSAVAQEALSDVLAVRAVDEWLEAVSRLKPSGIPRAVLDEALAAAKDEIAGLD